MTYLESIVRTQVGAVYDHLIGFLVRFESHTNVIDEGINLNLAAPELKKRTTWLIP